MKICKFLALSVTFTAMASVFALSPAGKTIVDRKMPEWVSKPADAYPQRLYITSVGCGSDETSSHEDAVSDLARNFITNISSTQKTYLYADQKIDFAQVEEFITSTTKLNNISGITVREVYHSKNGNIYTLVTLNRQEAADFYLQKIKTNDCAIRDLISATVKSPGDFFNCRYCQQALKLADDNQYYQFLIDVLNPVIPAQTDLSYQSQTKLRQVCTSITEKIELSVEVAGDINNINANAFNEVFSNMGIHSITNNNSRYILKAVISTLPADNSDTKHVYLNYTLSAQIYDSKLKKNIFSFQKSGREGHTTQANALNRVMLTCSSQIKTNFMQDLNNFLVDYSECSEYN